MRAVVAALALSGCAGAAAVPPLSAGPDPLRPGPQGLAVAGTDLEIGFGRSLGGAEAAIARLLGPPEARLPCEGGGAVLTWPTGLATHFAGGAFSGWEAGGLSAGRLCPVG